MKENAKAYKKQIYERLSGNGGILDSYTTTVLMNLVFD
jgi:hypothetical protein